MRYNDHYKRRTKEDKDKGKKRGRVIGQLIRLMTWRLQVRILPPPNHLRCWTKILLFFDFRDFNTEDKPPKQSIEGYSIDNRKQKTILMTKKSLRL